MTAGWVERIVAAAAEGPCVRVVVVRVDGSAPREVGAAMLVWSGKEEGTIGGGTLEFEAIRTAHDLLHGTGTGEPADTPPKWQREVRLQALGPALGQCCGGHVGLLFEVYGAAEIRTLKCLAEGHLRNGLVARPLREGTAPDVVVERKQDGERPLAVTQLLRAMLSGRKPAGAQLVRLGALADSWFVEPAADRTHPLYLYGAGHVGRALVRVLEDAPFDVTWIDTDPARFPSHVRAAVRVLPAADPAAAARLAPPDAIHLVMTFSHPLDLAICHAVLTNDAFGHLGLIGSKTKRERFRKRLAELGHTPAVLDRVICPIGVPGVPGKAPAAIAISVAADLLQRVAVRERAYETPRQTTRRA